MFIDKVTIAGFKSYKEQTMMEPFSPKHNVVVGRYLMTNRNGSGKSNFFWAIRFVLGDAYQNMTREERQSLLHEGQGHSTISAFVEIIFDNTDNRFPTGKDTVVLRRTIGLKKDEYSLDKKSVTKSEVMNLLESAGFSRSNPYYIVPQGRITALTNSKDQERLQLLKEVAGTKVYEQRRQESQKIMQETSQKRTQIHELLEYIETRLEELEVEKTELDLFTAADKERRCLEYALYTKDQTDAIQQLDTLEQDRQEGQQLTIDMYKQQSDRQININESEQELTNLKSRLDLIDLEKRQVQEDLNDHLKQKANLQLKIKDFTETLDQSERGHAELLNEKIEIESLVLQEKKTLHDLVPEFEKLLEKETRERNRLEELTVELDQLYF
jgi:structural maintenance of chromosome 3 (chondroitin sulfate proteoglycan 6)